jgi:hypothetical protein
VVGRCQLTGLVYMLSTGDGRLLAKAAVVSYKIHVGINIIAINIIAESQDVLDK